MKVSDDPRIGTELLGYRLEALLGRGGMGVVYRAYDPRLKRNVALKLLASEYASDERFRERFLSETEIAASLEHPNVVPIHDAGEVDGQLYLVMRYVEGADLKRLLAEDGPLEEARAISICSQIADALDAAHERGLVHRDVKPSNVLLDSREHAYLADFGLTRRLAEQAPGFDAGLSLGTPAYVAPEQIEGKNVDGRTDQYSLACLLHECLTGEPPFPRPSEAATLFAHLEEPPPAPPGLEEVMRKALAKDPAARYETCAALVEAARQALGIAEPRARRWPLAVAAIVISLIAALLLAFFVSRVDSPPAANSGSITQIDARTNRVVGRVQVGEEPGEIAYAQGRIWVANVGAGTLSRLDPDTSIVETISAEGTPTGLAAFGNTVFVAHGAPAESVTLIDAARGGAYDTVRLPGAAGFATAVVAAGREGVWLVDKETWRIVRIDPSAGRVVARGRVQLDHSVAEINDIAVGDSAVWLAGDVLDSRLWRIDPSTASVSAVVRLRIAPKRIATGEGSVWVTGAVRNVVARIDARTGKLLATIATGRGASGVAVGAGAVWVVNSLDGTLSRIDPATNAVSDQIAVGPEPRDVVVVGENVWVTRGS